MTDKIQTIINSTKKQLFNVFWVDNTKDVMKALVQLLDTKSDDWIIDELLPRQINGCKRTIIRKTDKNWKQSPVKVKYDGYCPPTLLTNFCINYKMKWWMFKSDIEDSFIS